jgi:mannose-6-phosphate isomerase-like protein (cupin superfamily)
MKFTYPRTIDNGSGEEITFLNMIQDDAGGVVELENRVGPGAGPPMHVHYLQDESLTVISGKIGAQVLGRQPVYGGPGDTFTFRRGEIHKFWNAGDDVLICKGWVKPAHNFEYFLTEIYRSTKANGGHGPSKFDGAYLMSKYKSEFDLMEIPTIVKKLIFPITLFLGKLKGKHRKYDNAPAPVKA